jgi:hypothetical protein
MVDMPNRFNFTSIDESSLDSIDKDGLIVAKSNDDDTSDVKKARGDEPINLSRANVQDNSNSGDDNLDENNVDNLTDEEKFTLIDNVRTTDLLWNIRTRQHVFPQQMTRAWQKVATAMGKSGL